MCGSSDFNKQAVFERFSKAAKILDSNGYVAHEVSAVSSRRDLEAELLHSRLKTDTFACLQIPNSFDIYVLFSDMTVFFVRRRNVADPHGGVFDPGY